VTKEYSNHNALPRTQYPEESTITKLIELIQSLSMNSLSDSDLGTKFTGWASMTFGIMNCAHLPPKRNHVHMERIAQKRWNPCLQPVHVSRGAIPVGLRLADPIEPAANSPTVRIDRKNLSP
jgi:hypothetical protein